MGILCDRRRAGEVHARRDYQNTRACFGVLTCGRVPMVGPEDSALQKPVLARYPLQNTANLLLGSTLAQQLPPDCGTTLRNTRRRPVPQSAAILPSVMPSASIWKVFTFFRSSSWCCLQSMTGSRDAVQEGPCGPVRLLVHPSGHHERQVRTHSLVCAITIVCVLAASACVLRRRTT